VKGKVPLIYGICEFFVGVAVSYVSMYPQTHYLVTEDSGTSFLPKALGVIGGIYVTVRDLSNVNDGLPKQYRAL
jgi:hypothetical protein